MSVRYDYAKTHYMVRYKIPNSPSGTLMCGCGWKYPAPIRLRAFHDKPYCSKQWQRHIEDVAVEIASEVTPDALVVVGALREAGLLVGPHDRRNDQ